MFCFVSFGFEFVRVVLILLVFITSFRLFFCLLYFLRCRSVFVLFSFVLVLFVRFVHSFVLVPNGSIRFVRSFAFGQSDGRARFARLGKKRWVFKDWVLKDRVLKDWVFKDWFFKDWVLKDWVFIKESEDWVFKDNKIIKL